MNQKVVIYIILSAILLYLYYKRGGVVIFAAFVVVVAGTLFAGAGAGAREGMSLGGGGKGDKECVKMGFTETKIDKKNIIGSLKKINDSYKKTLLKYATFDENGKFELKKETEELLKPIYEDPEAKSKIEKAQKVKNLFSFIITVLVFFITTYTKSESGEMTIKIWGK